MFVHTLIAAAVLAATPVQPEPHPQSRYMISPARAAFVREMLGNDPPLPDGCACTGVSIRWDRIVGEYGCPEKPRAILELAGPLAPGPSLRTERFAIFIRSEDFPPALLDTLVARIRARERAWRWVPSDRPLEEPEQPPVAEVAILLALAIAVLHLALDRPRYRDPEPLGARARP